MANPSDTPCAPGPGAEGLHTAIARLDELVRTLREQCPWDREQTHISLRRYLLEETYEALEALDARVGRDGEAQDLDRDLCEELGDLLYQVWFQAHLASERGAFGIVDVAQGVRDKLVARHPHVYGDVVAPDADAVRANWDAIKLQEKGRDSVMDGISQTLPALLRAVKVQKRAAAAGLSTDERPPGPFIETEGALAELRADPNEHTLGELLMAAVELGRRIKVDPEDALRSATERAESRYRALEAEQG
ncbi:MAG: MazG family protein [Acidimicrobiaceae bacterium]|nr:MazG family protein [Acidimicrobiaceae bacterium]